MYEYHTCVCPYLSIFNFSQSIYQSTTQSSYRPSAAVFPRHPAASTSPGPVLYEYLHEVRCGAMVQLGGGGVVWISYIILWVAVCIAYWEQVPQCAPVGPDLTYLLAPPGTITTTIYTTRCYNYTSITYSEPGVSYSHHPSNQATKQPTILLLFHLRPPPSKIPIPFPWTDLMCAIHLRAAFNRLILRWFSPSHVQTSLPPAIRYTTPHQLKATPLPGK